MPPGQIVARIPTRGGCQLSICAAIWVWFAPGCSTQGALTFLHGEMHSSILIDGTRPRADVVTARGRPDTVSARRHSPPVAQTRLMPTHRARCDDW